jgi:hypothetical protein
VRIEAAEKNDQAVCPGCGSLFYASEGKFASKYFRGSAPASRRHRHFLLLPAIWRSNDALLRREWPGAVIRPIPVPGKIGGLNAQC